MGLRMVKIVINANIADASALEGALRSMGQKEICAIGGDAGALAAAMNGADRVAVIDVRAKINDPALQAFLDYVNANEQVRYAYAPVSSGSDSVELPELTAGSLASFIAQQNDWPLMAVMLPTSLSKDVADMGDMPARTAVAQALIKAIADAEFIGASALPMVTDDSTTERICQLTDAELAACLRYAVRVSNIEDLFPNHAWDRFEKESAAASYHTLAGMFIKLNDIESAIAALAVSDSLEESPRSLALKGIIAELQGETLGAVANMVSSLQQYELRKKNNKSVHYVSFAPRDMEVVNDNLRQGLAALNRRDNDSALGHFSEAVFQFDEFYTQIGIDRRFQK